MKVLFNKKFLLHKKRLRLRLRLRKGRNKIWNINRTRHNSFISNNIFEFMYIKLLILNKHSITNG